MARSRSPLLVMASGCVQEGLRLPAGEASSRARLPLEATRFTRVIPLGSSGASRPLSEASTASSRTAVIFTLMETAPSPRASTATRQAATVAFRKARPRHLAIPGEELIGGKVVNAFRNRRGGGIEHEGLQPAPICAFVHYS